ncbi:hypothetical protein MUK70_10915 [Dyadobacter chenwenxiniae]|uniref:Uncharacterized protein n=1 Tax=Dyadobacter chenwenxiniae TaxID=2906456 RepID=A0A9X1PSC3_9BACT|nr:hypothetical protein [Dyadobacter chenwenxiniae]MCF0065585.1 hypothetical protein [Dyadobacter chenwenxiniae]UON85496.1 hypothetical protein MUK70_10915 [Dyadobacter chenwenxiniae]
MDIKTAVDTITGLQAAKDQIDEEIQDLIAKRQDFDSSISWFMRFIETHKKNQLHEFGEAVKRANGDFGVKVPAQEVETEGFPMKADRKKQIIWTLKEIGRFVKLKYLGDEVKDNLNAHDLKSETFLRTPVNAMLEEGGLVSVRYNKSWKKVFYGLPEWLGTLDNGEKYILEEFEPSPDETGYGYDTIEFEYEPRKFNKEKEKEEAASNEIDEDNEEDDEETPPSANVINWDEDDLPF